MSPRETRILATAAVLTALHVLDDATLHREPGTALADHVTGPGALLAVLAGSALLFPRLRAGGQAVLAPLLGALSLTLGVLHLVEVGLGPGGTWDALGGTLTAAAGGAALVLGTIVLWRARRRDGSRGRRYLRRTLVVVAAAFGAYSRPEEYERRVTGFFDRHLLDTRS